MKSGKKILNRLKTGGSILVAAIVIIILLLMNKCSGNLNPVKELVRVDTVINNVFIRDTIYNTTYDTITQIKIKHKPVIEYIYQVCDQLVDTNLIKQELIDSINANPDKYIKSKLVETEGENYKITSSYKYVGELLSAIHAVEVEEREIIKEVEKIINKEVVLKHKLGLYSGFNTTYDGDSFTDFAVMLNIGNDNFQIGLSKSIKHAKEFQINFIQRINKKNYK